MERTLCPKRADGGVDNWTQWNMNASATALDSDNIHT